VIKGDLNVLSVLSGSPSWSFSPVSTLMVVKRHLAQRRAFLRMTSLILM